MAQPAHLVQIQKIENCAYTVSPLIFCLTSKSGQLIMVRSMKAVRLASRDRSTFTGKIHFAPVAFPTTKKSPFSDPFKANVLVLLTDLNGLG
jgi:hypothetical protein